MRLKTTSVPRPRTHGPREVLNELKWHRQALERALVHYVHRPEGERVVEGKDITEFGPSHFARRTRASWRPGRIPYHRVTRIELDGETVWERRAPDGPMP
ncbi:MAG TPA: RNA repair domain-containing protein [Candidatus Thermoplasmatota archaeon]|nr:RNA repair domain-containing protein [Candidatus Thermoplasmatota archaeon]